MKRDLREDLGVVVEVFFHRDRHENARATLRGRDIFGTPLTETPEMMRRTASTLESCARALRLQADAREANVVCVPPPRRRSLDELVVQRARQLTEMHGAFASAHEIFGVLAEELDEFFQIVKQRESMRSTSKMIRELVDIASAALRAANQLAAKLDHEPTEAEVLRA